MTADKLDTSETTIILFRNVNKMRMVIKSVTGHTNIT